MIRSTSHRLFGLFLTLILAVMPAALQACATCYGASDSPMARGMNAGIMTLLVVIGGVLAGIVAFFVYVIRRGASMSAAAGTESSSHNN